MTVRFKDMWLFWLVGLTYSICASATGIFPSITFEMRLSTLLDIAWFIGGLWLLTLLRNWLDGKAQQ